ncbi:hypothetical protein BpHYR1_016938 [Brachionus plicatilis]|uniref:Uncharacterized protein n=1 Tax=Brachionus plicatilis TaxID=10195 RepID=A0A3M7SRN0_BRAPC|nr:hypothetical protein BpHYR1_016938 [Brachionus plicatilis]
MKSICITFNYSLLSANTISSLKQTLKSNSYSKETKLNFTTVYLFKFEIALMNIKILKNKEKVENQRDNPFSITHSLNSFHKLHNGDFFLQGLELLTKTLTQSLINSIISIF